MTKRKQEDNSVEASVAAGTRASVRALRSLYRSARRMACSDEDNVLLNFLIEDLINTTEFERVLLLILDPSTEYMEAYIGHGFQDAGVNGYRVPFNRLRGLLKKVYYDREPVNIINYSELANSSCPSKFCAVYREDRSMEARPERRQRITLCVPGFRMNEDVFGHYRQFQHYSLMYLSRRDEVIDQLLGNIDAFLILPICDETKFYGFVLADKSLSGSEITYDEIRLSSAVVRHAGYAIGRARKHQEMLIKIADQLNEIQQIKSFYQSIIQNLRSGLVTVDQYLKINSVNKAAEVILGYDALELLGKPMDYFFAGSDATKKCFFLDSADEVDASMGLVMEVSMRRKDGEIFPAEVCYSVITDTDHEITGLSCIFQDITNRKNMEQNLARIDRLASLGELAAGVAHEIRNPLAGIAGAIQVISRNQEPDSPHHFIFQEVLEQVRRLDGFVNNLLKFAKPGQSKFTKVQIEGVIKKALFLIKTQLQEKNISVHKEFDHDIPFIMGDVAQLQQVFLNIFLNAVDAMGDGGVLTIKTGYDKRRGDAGNNHCPGTPDCICGGELRVAVTDTGEGIDAGMHETIFNPFHTTKGNGTGLGLSISHRIIEQHGGTITVKSARGRGSTFTVQLPVCSDQTGEKGQAAALTYGVKQKKS